MKSAILSSMLILSCCAFAAGTPSGPQETVIYTFQGSTDGGNPTSGLIADTVGNLYGAMGNGVYEVFPPSQPGDPWTESVIYSFQSLADGNALYGSLVFDSKGNLYGATYDGGSCSTYMFGCGVVFELSPPSQPGGQWTETVLYNFQGGPEDGEVANGGLVFDSSGNLYGTTQEGGDQNCYIVQPTCGVVFKLAPPSAPGAPWTESVLHIFQGGTDGGHPAAGLAIDTAGNLYGTTVGGGDPACEQGCGTVFKLTRPSGEGKPWVENIIARFHNDAGGYAPYSPVTIYDDALYGTTFWGTVFKISTSNGIPVRSTIFRFPRSLCVTPSAGVIFDQSGNLYSATSAGGCQWGGGFVYELKPPSKSGGSWTGIKFPGLSGGVEGNDPVGGVTIVGNAIYGATAYGGNPICTNGYGGCGIIYSYGQP